MTSITKNNLQIENENIVIPMHTDQFQQELDKDELCDLILIMSLAELVDLITVHQTLDKKK